MSLAPEASTTGAPNAPPRPLEPSPTRQRGAREPSPTRQRGAQPLAPLSESLCCFSVDVEEYFHAEAYAATVPASQRASLPRRAGPALLRLAEILDQTGARATFFVLGSVVRDLRPVLRQLAAAGHEIACHGWSHEPLWRLDARTLREDLVRARGEIADCLGVRPRGYRAPTFSLTRATAWAADCILEAGFAYDASIFPIWHDRYGIPDAPADPFWLISPSGARLLEFPPLTVGLAPSWLRLGAARLRLPVSWTGPRLPVGGGGYLRLLPGPVLRWCVRAAMRRARPVMLYIHPWEIDPAQPDLPLGRLARWRHRVGLRSTERKLRALLAGGRWESASTVLERVIERGELPRFRLHRV